MSGKQAEEETNMILGNEPVQTRCPFCGTQTETDIMFTNGLITYILGFISFMVLGVFFSMLIIPLLFVFTKSLVHRCGSCEQEIGTNGEIIYGLGLKDGVTSLKFGEIGFILTRKIFITVVLGILALGILSHNISNMQTSSTRHYGHSHLHDKVEWTNATWPDFINECGLDKIETHQQYHECEHKFIDKSVRDWEGYIIRIEDYRQTLYQYLHHAVSILVKIDEKDSDNHADVLLTFDSEQVDIFEETLNNLGRGKHIAFNGTMKSIGNIQQTRHMHILQIQEREGFKDIPSHVHNGGRYDDTPRRMRGKGISKQPAQIAEAEKQEK